MKLITCAPFRTDEIEQKFEDIIGTGFAHQTIEVEEADVDKLKEMLQDDNVESLDSESIPRKPVHKKVERKSEFGQVYSYKSWLRRVFTTNIALEPKPSTSDRFPKDYLHSRFKWCRLIPFDSEQEKAGNYEFLKQNVITYWLSAFLGFFSYMGNIVQVNPAELYALTFVEPDKRQELASKLISEVRIIPVSDWDNKFVYNQFRYYINSIAGFDHCERLQIKNQIPTGIQDHFLLKNHEKLQYLENRFVSKDEFIQHLLPLGTIVVMGWNHNVDVELTNNKRDDKTWNIRDFQECFKRELSMDVFTNGCFAKFIRLNIDIEGLDLTEELLHLSNYLKSIARRKDSHVSISDLRQDMIQKRIYDKATADNKFFINKKFIPDAEFIGFKIEQRTGMTADSTGVQKKSRLIVVTAPTTKSTRK